MAGKDKDDKLVEEREKLLNKAQKKMKNRMYRNILEDNPVVIELVNHVYKLTIEAGREAERKSKKVKPLPSRLELLLLNFLKSRERDIALCIEDFGTLREVFHYLCGWKPREDDRREKLL